MIKKSTTLPTYLHPVPRKIHNTK